MMHLLTLVLYVLICLLIGYLGKYRKFGFWGYTIAAFLLTPLMGILLLIASDERPRQKDN